MFKKIILLFLIHGATILAAVQIAPISDHISIKISDFSAPITDQTLTQLSPFNHTPAIIVDLRNNMGGGLYNALTFSALFVTKNELITIRSNTDQTVITRPENHPYFKTKKLIILTNDQTASAAEAAAYALSNHPNAIIIGTNTMGKSEITSKTKSPKYTHFYLPNHHIIPDVFFRFSAKDDDQMVYLSAIKKSDQFLKERDSIKAAELTTGNGSVILSSD